MNTSVLSATVKDIKIDNDQWEWEVVIYDDDEKPIQYKFFEYYCDAIMFLLENGVRKKNIYSY